MRHLYFTFFVLLLAQQGFSQTLKGKVLSVSGEEVPFAKVRVAGTSYGTVANGIGVYQLEWKDSLLVIEVIAPGYETSHDTLYLGAGITSKNILMTPKVKEILELKVVSQTDKQRGKEVMKQVIDKRPFFYEQTQKYRCDTYCFASLEKEVQDSIMKDSVIGKESMNLLEWRAHSYYKADHQFKDEFYAFNDFQDENKVFVGTSISVSFDGSDDQLAPGISGTNEPYLFGNSSSEITVNLFENQLELPRICSGPIVSPLAYNATVYYLFYHRNTITDEQGKLVYEIEVKPRFTQEALFEGTLFIRDSTWELVSYDLGINRAALLFFSQIRIIADYHLQNERLVTKRREFIYEVKEGKTRMNGTVKAIHSDYSFEFDDSKRKFWLETQVMLDEALQKDSAYWEENRPFKLKEFEKRFIHQQDSAITYHESEEYMRKMDSTRNRIGVLDLIFGGYAHVNSFKKYRFRTFGLVEQIVPFGVGGFRYRFGVTYNKEFKNAKGIRLEPMVDYGFLNKDLKGSMEVGFMYDPFHFTEISFELGDVYEFVSTYQNIQGTFAPGNRVRNQKVGIGFKTELVNGLYLRSKLLYSDRQSIQGIKYPEWLDTIFGIFSVPQAFDRYRIFLTTLELEYHFNQKYRMKKDRKLVLGSPWPVLNLVYKKGIPNIASTEANFDYLELRLSDKIKLNTLGESDLRFVSGWFMRKKDLRLMEHRFFRTSDQIFFSDPLLSLQLLDTALNTSNSFIQFNFIHHFNGFFLNKIWGINRLKLAETIGGSLLVIPDAKFAQVEFYVGIERRCRIKREIFKIGLYAVTTDNTFAPASIRLKLGINMYNTFNGTWDY